ncbi:MAG TPA: LLM class F420-dependent oxidoreductase [Solirubrobacterales bacterium]|nr:LLM class F420-dependent oxidoreductase [Solirubrobacterales bacterium]
MASARRLGLELTSNLSIGERVELARWAEDRGYQDAWVAEISDPEAFVSLALVAQATSRIRLGTAIVQMGPRSVPVMAAASASLAEVSAGRFALGLGVSTEVIVQGWHGVTRGRPLVRSRETVELLRHLLAGGRSDQGGEYVRSRGFRLRLPPATPPQIMLAAMNEKMLELAGEIADGVLLTFLPVSAVGLVTEAVRRGADRAGREKLPELILVIPTEVTDDEEAALARFTHDISFYLTAPPYRKALGWYGFEEQMERAEHVWTTTRSIDKVRAEVPHGLPASIGVFGSYETCRERFEQYWEAGIGTLGVTVPPAAPAMATLEPFAQLAAATASI